jgi:hypothetical protein
VPSFGKVAAILTTNGEKAMTNRQGTDPSTSLQPVDVARRRFLAQAVTLGAAAVALPRFAGATTEIWEEGDLQCRPPVAPIKPGYDVNDPALFRTFMGLSEKLTGIAPLDEHIGRKYLQRFASHPLLTAVLPQLVQAYRAIAPSATPPTDALVEQRIMQDAALRFGAEQVIFVWYLSAFYLPPPPPTPDPMKPPPPQPASPPKSVWIYGSPEEYGAGLIWSLIHAHAPMTPGGPPGYWADPPSA